MVMVMVCIAVNEPKPSLEMVHWPSSIPVSTSGVSSGKVIPMKNLYKYSTGEDLTLLRARDAIATASLRKRTMCAASQATRDEILHYFQECVFHYKN